MVVFLNEILPNLSMDPDQVDQSDWSGPILDAALVVADPLPLLARQMDYRTQAQAALAAMTPVQAAFVRATVMAGEPVTGMAGMMGRSRKTVWVAVKRGLERGKQALVKADLCD